MAKILVGYERGDNLGHYRRLAPVAEALAAEGHQVTFFLRNPYDCRSQLTANPLPFIQSPDLVPPNPAERGPKKMGSYSDIMVYCGFGKIETLFPATLAWRTIFDQVRPDLIVCDHSPVICFAAYGRIPVIQVGSGFTIPPAQAAAFPGFQPGKTATVAPEEIVAVMNEVQRRLGGPRVPSVTAPLRTTGRLVCTLKGLDPYKDQREDPVVGPTEGLQPPLPLPDKPAVFAYLGIEHRITPKMLALLKASELPVEAYVRGMTEATASKYIRPGLTFYKSPQPIDQVLSRATLAIHHGGSGMSLACCSAGRPQLALPIHEETLLNSQALARVGVGRMMSAKELESAGAETLSEFEASPQRRERAAIIAREIVDAGPFRPMDHILQACRASLGNA
ncbi:nucleotide disphospho-sugar-binding domain-containing protein [Pelagibius sp. CAU 1746]|uniref:glycosyltransferase n=1 Tax=Pelagibius sp. CAU 1746 TaxID=3140370 RepID=UPI00325A563A